MHLYRNKLFWGEKNIKNLKGGHEIRRHSLTQASFNIPTQWLFVDFHGGNIITTYEAINNTRGHLTVNSQSTQRQSLSDGERLLGARRMAGGWDVVCQPFHWVCFVCVCVCRCGRLERRQSLSRPTNGWIRTMPGTRVHTNAHTHRTPHQSGWAVDATGDPPFSCNNAKKAHYHPLNMHE